MATYDIVAGTTNPLQFQLVENGVPINLGSVTVTLLLSDSMGNTIFSPGMISIVDSANGKVQFTPMSAFTFVAASGPYYARWVLTSAGNLVSYVPTSIRDVWNIVGT